MFIFTTCLCSSPLSFALVVDLASTYMLNGRGRSDGSPWIDTQVEAARRFSNFIYPLHRFNDSCQFLCKIQTASFVFWSCLTSSSAPSVR